MPGPSFGAVAALEVRAVERCAGSFFVGAVRVDEPRPDAPEARPFDLVLVAMRSTLRPAADEGVQARRVSAQRPRRARSARPVGAPSPHRSRRTMVSRPGEDATTEKPSER
jgi:hypothetical protein